MPYQYTFGQDSHPSPTHGLQELPMPTSRVTLEPRVQDRYGMPAVRLLGEGPHDEDLRAAEFMVEQARDWLRASGAKRIHPVRLIYPKWPSGGQHQAGTCRMGLDPRTSVTDSWGRVWGQAGPLSP